MSDNDPWNWDETRDNNKPTHSSKVIDLSFNIKCRCIHVDHTHGLHAAITNALPWFSEESGTGLHLIHVAGTQNGWMRPDGPDELLYLSRRTHLTIRIPMNRIEDTRKLIGQTLDIAGNHMEIGTATEKPLIPNDILFSRYVITQGDDDESTFLRTVTQQLKGMNIQVRKILPGKQQILRGPHGKIRTHSLMIADLAPVDSLTLQEKGLGEGREYGCGLFIHHKGISTLNPDDFE